MTNDELQKLAAALGDCGKALLKISEAMAVKEDNPPDSEAKSKKRKSRWHWKMSAKSLPTRPARDSRKKSAALFRSTGRTSSPALTRRSTKLS
jgi:hypothetical protein